MGEYGVTPKGFILKRFDEIYRSIAERVKRYSGIDVTQKTESVLNLAILYPVCGMIAELHEENLDIYNSLHPSTAEGIALDDAAQFSNIRRKPSSRSVYLISCNVVDGNTVLKGTEIAADTNPRHDLLCDADTIVSREAWNELYIRLVTVAAGQTYEVYIDDERYVYVSESSSETEILAGLAECISVPGIEVTVERGQSVLALRSTGASDLHRTLLSETLTTESVTGLVSFSSEEYGSIIMPDRTITKIISNRSTGFNWCENRLQPQAGRLAAEDYEFRQDYIAQIYSHSSNMAASISAYLLQNVPGIESVNVYENYNDTIDAEGRLPHSVEVIAEGGTDEDVAYAILRSRAGGIQTNGDIEIECAGEGGDAVLIAFNRPKTIYAWIKVSITGIQSAVPENYRRIILDLMEDAYGELKAGDTFYNQQTISEIYKKIPGLTRVVITQAHFESAEATPSEADYRDENIVVKKREKVLVSENRMKVVLNG